MDAHHSHQVLLTKAQKAKRPQRGSVRRRCVGRVKYLVRTSLQEDRAGTVGWLNLVALLEGCVDLLVVLEE